MAAPSFSMVAAPVSPVRSATRSSGVRWTKRWVLPPRPCVATGVLASGHQVEGVLGIGQDPCRAGAAYVEWPVGTVARVSRRSWAIRVSPTRQVGQQVASAYGGSSQRSSAPSAVAGAPAGLDLHRPRALRERRACSSSTMAVAGRTGASSTVRAGAVRTLADTYGAAAAAACRSSVTGAEGLTERRAPRSGRIDRGPRTPDGSAGRESQGRPACRAWSPVQRLGLDRRPRGRQLRVGTSADMTSGSGVDARPTRRQLRHLHGGADRDRHRRCDRHRQRVG